MTGHNVSGKLGRALEGAANLLNINMEKVGFELLVVNALGAHLNRRGWLTLVGGELADVGSSEVWIIGNILGGGVGVKGMFINSKG